MKSDQGRDGDPNADEQRERYLMERAEARRGFCGSSRSKRAVSDLSQFSGDAEVGVEAKSAQCDRRGDQQGTAAERLRDERQRDAGECAIEVEFREYRTDERARQFGRRQQRQRGRGDHRAEEQGRAEPATEQQPEAAAQHGLAQRPIPRWFRSRHGTHSLQAPARCKEREDRRSATVVNHQGVQQPRPSRGLRGWLTDRLARYMSEPVGHYDLRAPNDFDRLKATIRKGDVLLVEGDQRVSAVIKYLTRSSWSHAVLYIGDELLRRDDELKRRSRETFGDAAEHLIVEALFDGVVASSLAKYIDFNVRLCRPHRLRSDHLKIVLDDAVAAIGWRYDLRNILDLAVHLIFVTLLPRRHREEVLRFGSGASSRVICTSLLGQLFHKVGFPVLPSVTYPEESGVEETRIRRRPWSLIAYRRRRLGSGLYRRRHPTLLTPRDFDLSPYFQIVKFNRISARNFDYSQIEWEPEVEPQDTAANDS